MKTMNAIQYVSDNNGIPTGVIVPMELWGKIKSERKLAMETTVDALAEIAKLAQPLGSVDLARNFDSGKRIADEPAK